MSDISRITFWERAGKMIIALPFTGNGIGSFFVTSLQYQNPERKEYYDDQENAHNYFLQIAAELGLPAVLIFMGILYHVFCSGLINLREERNSWPMKGFLLGLSAYIFTWLTGHPLLIAKQQFLFWFMAFLIVFWPRGTSEDPLRVVPSLRFLIGLMVLLLVGYSIKMGPASKDLTYEVGFYPSDVVDGQEVRWIGEKAFLCTQQKGKFMSFDIYAISQNVGANGLKFQVRVNGQLWDDTCLTRDGKRKFQYYLPWTDSKLIKIMLQAGRTFNPARLGMNTDTRNLGVRVGKINFSDRLPSDGIGFYDSEIFPAEELRSLSSSIPRRFRWTGLRASMNMEGECQKGITLYLKSAHPDVSNNPVKVSIFRDQEQVREIIFHDGQWQKLFFDQNTIGNSQVLTFQISRTWNPKLLGLSDNSRDLGIAVVAYEDLGEAVDKKIVGDWR